MRNPISHLILLMALLSASFPIFAAADIEINTPAITSLKQSMQQRHGQLEAYYTRGAVGFTRDGLIAMRDANALPLSARQSVNTLIASENEDRNALYREIARANGRPEWEQDIRSTFGQRWIDLARPGWWYQAPNGSWGRK